MSVVPEVCPFCGGELVVGSWPFCPDHGKGVHASHGDDIPGGQWFENGFAEPRKFYSHSEHRAALAAEGCEIRAKWAGSNDRHLKRWDAPCAYTLEAAKALVSRRSRSLQPIASSAPEEEMVLVEKRDTGRTFRVARPVTE